MAIRSLALSVLVSAAFLPAQTYYDDFGGPGLDPLRWYFPDPTTTMTQTGGVVRVRVPANQPGEDLETTFGFDGDFDLQFEYRALSGTGMVSFGIYDADPTLPSSDFWIGVTSAAAGQLVQTGSATSGWLTTMGAGSLRLSLAAGMLTAAYRPATTQTWTPLATQASTFGPVVQAWIELDGGTQAFAIDCDGLASLGPRLRFPASPLVAPHQIGRRCHGLGARAGGFPFLGTQTFGLGVSDAQPATQTWLMLGTSSSVWMGLSLPFNLGVIGDASCALNVSPDLTVPAPSTDAFGEAAFFLRVPNDATLRGQSLFGQFLALDATAPLGLSLSNGVAFVFL